MKRLRYEDLPEELARLVGNDDFLHAAPRPDVGTIIIWVRNRELGRQWEREFDLSAGKFWSIEERKASMPDSSEIYFRERKWKVRISYEFEEGTEVCYEVYDASQLKSPKSTIQASQIYFGPARTDILVIVEEAIKKANFPKVYAKWSNKQKAGYWIASLHRLRRSNGESGFEEDFVFDPKLISDMRRLDPKIERIIPAIISGLALMEHLEPSELMETFKRRTGYKPPKKKPILLLLVCFALGFAMLFTLNAQFRQSTIVMGLVIYYDIIKPNDPVTRTIRNGSNEWGTAIALTPKPFKTGDAQDDVLRQLSKAKYTVDTDKSFSWRKPRLFPEGSQFYEKSVEGLPCSVHFEVVVRFDDKHGLLEAWGTEDEAGCL